MLLAPLDSEDAQGWIERAVRERWSVSDLRIELRAAQRDRSELPAAPPADPTPDADELVGIVCPQCGHRLSPPGP